MNATRTCTACRGRGRQNLVHRVTGERKVRTCPTCRGKGTVEVRVVNRRTAEQIAAARDAIVQAVGTEWTKAPADASAADMTALVKAGRLERAVRREWEALPNRHHAFGGTNVALRNRAYYRRPLV